MHDEFSAESNAIELLRSRDPDGLAAAYDLYAGAAFALLVALEELKAPGDPAPAAAFGNYQEPNAIGSATFANGSYVVWRVLTLG